MYNYDIYMKTDDGMTPLNNNSSSDVGIMTGANAESDGKEGLVPAPTKDDVDKCLRGDGTWGHIYYSESAEQDQRGNKIHETYAQSSVYSVRSINLGRRDGKQIGDCSSSMGALLEASGFGSHSEGRSNASTGLCSHSEGELSNASGNYSHAEGNKTNASALASHAEGIGTIAENKSSHACGHYNVMITDDNTGTAFAIGNGSNDLNRSNAFSVTFEGTTKVANTITASTTADYAEFFEWEDSNTNNEDRVGKFVTLHNDKITIAKSNEDYILGIVSGAPFVLGNGDCDVWNGMYLRDDFGRLIYEPVPKEEFDEETGSMKEVFDEDGNLVYEGKRRKPNPDYDPTQKYVSRFDRPEWSPVGMLGVLSVFQDGTCEVNGYCCCNKDGIATACDRNTQGAYRVIKKISDQVVRVIFR